MGLANYHEINSKHHGSISVESETGVGTSFTICIRFADQDDAESKRTALAECLVRPNGKGE